VRRAAGGEFTEQLFDQDPQNALLTIEGPLGQFVYQPHVATLGVAVTPGFADTPKPRVAPMLLIGGGTGLAPLLSILRHVIENGIERDMILYWGVRSERDLYAHAVLEDLAQRCPAESRPARLRYAPVLSEPSPDWRGSRGFVHEAVLEDIDDLARYDVYAAGPPAMIAAVRREFGRRGVAANRLFFDSFDYAPDTLDRQRMSAATKS
jgi:CDP-4-dehydro-6-deoxyglucose reductase